MQGAKFLRHSPLQKFSVNVVEAKHPATAHLPATWKWEDECYFFTNMNPDIRVLLSVDTRTLKDPKLKSAPGQQSGGVFPLAWCHEFEGGRVFYTSLGHPDDFSGPVLPRLLRNAVEWVLAK